MPRYHLIRVGALGHIGRFQAVDQLRYPRGSRVVVRTERGLEVGDVLSAPTDDAEPRDDAGELLRGMTVEDELLAARLQKNRLAALEACQARLAQRELPAVLIDVEHLFDGRHLVFYFLGPTSAELDALTHDLAEVYDAQAQVSQFADALATGCGPDCGTEHATGHGCTDCSAGCQIAAACKR